MKSVALQFGLNNLYYEALLMRLKQKHDPDNYILAWAEEAERLVRENMDNSLTKALILGKLNSIIVTVRDSQEEAIWRRYQKTGAGNGW